jgi:hypothetical protein
MSALWNPAEFVGRGCFIWVIDDPGTPARVAASSMVAKRILPPTVCRTMRSVELRDRAILLLINATRHASVDLLEDAIVYECEILNLDLLSTLEEFHPSASELVCEVIREGIVIPMRQFVIRVSGRKAKD